MTKTGGSKIELMFRYVWLNRRRKFCFSGRSSRSEFWYVMLFYILTLVALIPLETLIFRIIFQNTEEFLLVKEIAEELFCLSIVTWFLFLFFRTLPLFVRRLHDAGKSGWVGWLILVPIIGITILLYLLCKDGEDGENRYGKDPKEIAKYASMDLEKEKIE